MKISIAMTTFNGAAHLAAQLESFLAQTRLPDELVMCDDGSTDDTLAIAEDYARKAPFTVRIVRNPTNLGFTRNFEQALSLCTGDIIFLSDQDDVWFPEKIAFISKSFEEHPGVQLVVHDGNLVDDKLQSHGATKLGQVVQGFGSSDSLVMGALTALRRDLVRYSLPLPVGMKGHDIWLHDVAGLLGVRLVLAEPLQLIRRHGSNTSNWVASSITRINKLDVWKSQLLSPVAQSYDDRLRINECATARLRAILAADTEYSRAVVLKSLDYLLQESRALKYRDSLAHSPRSKQKLMSMLMLCRGDYRYFNGFRSFLRDLSR
jgi:glycosyltransferase involved in cell wall biosynthesis